jgi:Na+/H+-dicarboxylate symporter
MTQTENINQPKRKPRRPWQLNSLTSQIFVASVLALIVGIGLHPVKPDSFNEIAIASLAIPADLIINALKVLAFPLVFVILIRTLLNTNIAGSQLRRLMLLLLTNTTVAILIGCLVFSAFPGMHPAGGQRVVLAPNQGSTIWGIILDLLRAVIPDNLIIIFVKPNVIPLIVVAISLGIVLRGIKEEQAGKNQTDYPAFVQIIEIFYKVFLLILSWVIALLPLAVFGIVARTVAMKGFEPLKSLIPFMLAVFLAYILQACYYLIRLKLSGRVALQDFLSKGKEAFVTAFGTSSGLATSPVTKKVLRNIGLSESFAEMGSFVIVNFNKDGTALSLAMSVLYIAQIEGKSLEPGQLLVLVFVSVIASMITVAIPNGGASGVILVFAAVGLNINQYFLLIFPIEWLIDMVRTVINVMGNMTTAVLLDEQTPTPVDKV